MAAHGLKFATAGCVVEFMQGNRPVSAWVQEERSGQLRLLTITKREAKVAASRLLPWIGPQYPADTSRQGIQDALEHHRAEREKIRASIDTHMLWDMAQSDIHQAEAFWFAELLWSDPDIDHMAAMGQALLEDKIRFKFAPPFFEVFDAEQVILRAEKLEREERQKELALHGAAFFKLLHETARNHAVLTPDRIPDSIPADELKRILLNRLADPESSEDENTWKMLVKDLSAKDVSQDEHLPLLLATAWGLVPEHYNFWLDRAGYTAGDAWSTGFSAPINKVMNEAKAFAKTNAAPVLTAPLVSIDPSSTRDWDDAFGVSLRPKGGYTLHVALACPAPFWPFGSELDRAVLRRASSLYLPEAEYFMMPETLCLNAFSLKADTPAPTLLLTQELSAEGDVLSMRVELASISAAANLRLPDTESVLAAAAHHAAETAPLPENPAAPFAPMLRHARSLASVLQRKRIAQGAVITERPETHVSLITDNGFIQVQVETLMECVESQTTVGEIMILANQSLAQWAVEHCIPIIHRSQDVTIPKDFSGVWNREEDIARVLKSMPPSLFGLEPKRHAALGVPVYGSFTAPMRRYADLTNESQIASFLTSGKARLSHDELASLLPLVNARADAVTQVQRARPRYWKLLFYQQQEQDARKQGGRKYWDAVITEENSHFCGVMLNCGKLYLRGPRALFAEKAMPGDPVQVRLGKINPLYNEIQLMEVLET